MESRYSRFEPPPPFSIFSVLFPLVIKTQNKIKTVRPWKRFLKILALCQKFLRNKTYLWLLVPYYRIFWKECFYIILFSWSLNWSQPCKYPCFVSWTKTVRQNCIATLYCTVLYKWHQKRKEKILLTLGWKRVLITPLHP